MKQLIDGLQKFVRTVHAEEQELFARLANSQEPDVLFITCSDSRVAPHLITQTGPGDLFVIRNAGNIIPHCRHEVGGEAASVEYAATALEVKDIIVCGHSNCGAMNGLLNLEALGSKLPAVKKWLEQCEPTRKIVEDQFSDLDEAGQLERAIEVNVLVQLNNLHSHPSVATRVAAGELRLHGWVYDIGTGHVRAFDHESRGFVSLVDMSQTQSNEIARGMAAQVAWPIAAGAQTS